MKPTDEQVKEFWEWCGLKKVQYDKEFFNEWQGWSDEGLVRLRIDLNNLFKYAVPKLAGLQQIILQPDGDNWYLGITVGNQLYENIGYDPALALFWAIYEVMK